MKRILCSILIPLLLLCSCASENSAPTEPAETVPVIATQPPTAAPTDAPKKSVFPKLSTEDLVKLRIASIMKTKPGKTGSISVEALEQYPELPTGCEAVALTIALNALGCKLEKTEIAEEYLQYDDNYVIGFCGDPFSDGGAGVMPIGIIATVDNYVKATGAKIYAYNSSHMPLSDLYKFIDAGCPVVMWTTYYMDEPWFTGESIDYDGETYQWYNNEHCVALYGYDRSDGTVDIADPLRGAVTVNADEFERINHEIGGWSVTLIDTSKLDTPATEKPTEKPTVKPTVKPTEKPAKKPTEKSTEKPTVKPASATLNKSAAATEKPTQPTVSKPAETQPATEQPTKQPKHKK